MQHSNLKRTALIRIGALGCHFAVYNIDALTEK